jgi:hypothetical protein
MKDGSWSGDEPFERASVALLIILVKTGSFRPRLLLQLGYSRQNVKRTMRRLLHAGVIEKSDLGYVLSRKLLSKVGRVTFGLEDMDGITSFAMSVCYGSNYTAPQAAECARRFGERAAALAKVDMVEGSLFDPTKPRSHSQAPA